ncbi:MAG: hypothetical protein KF892_24275 [Rhizobacter sp.]|nr:hypothetical protein [Rhizobacter sp.]
MQSHYFLALSMFAAGCTSVPIPPPLSGEETASISNAPKPALTAAIASCEHGAQVEFAHCTYLVKEVAEILKKTELFIDVKPSADATADIAVEIHKTPRRAHWTTPSHNPAAALLSLAIPFWWKESYGYHLTLREKKGRTVEVNTLREGTVVQWSLASLLNIGDKRALEPKSEREAEQLKVQILRGLQAGQTAK